MGMSFNDIVGKNFSVRKSTDQVTLFWSEQAAKLYGFYTATIVDDAGAKKDVKYTRDVTDPESYLFKDKERIGECRSCDLKDVQPHRPELTFKNPQPGI